MRTAECGSGWCYGPALRLRVRLPRAAAPRQALSARTSSLQLRSAGPSASSPNGSSSTVLPTSARHCPPGGSRDASGRKTEGVQLLAQHSRRRRGSRGCPRAGTWPCGSSCRGPRRGGPASQDTCTESFHWPLVVDARAMGALGRAPRPRPACQQTCCQRLVPAPRKAATRQRTALRRRWAASRHRTQQLKAAALSVPPRLRRTTVRHLRTSSACAAATHQRHQAAAASAKLRAAGLQTLLASVP